MDCLCTPPIPVRGGGKGVQYHLAKLHKYRKTNKISNVKQTNIVNPKQYLKSERFSDGNPLLKLIVTKVKIIFVSFFKNLFQFQLL